ALDVDIVDADARAAHDLQARSPVEHVARDACGTATDQRVVLRDLLEQLRKRSRRPLDDLDLRNRPKQRDALRIHLVRYEYPVSPSRLRHRATISSISASRRFNPSISWSPMWPMRKVASFSLPYP